MRAGAKAALRLDILVGVSLSFAPSLRLFSSPQAGENPGRIRGESLSPLQTFLCNRGVFISAFSNTPKCPPPKKLFAFKNKCKIIIIILIIAKAFGGKKNTDRERPHPDVKKIIPILLLK